MAGVLKMVILEVRVPKTEWCRSPTALGQRDLSWLERYLIRMIAGRDNEEWGEGPREATFLLA